MYACTNGGKTDKWIQELVEWCMDIMKGRMDK